MWVPDGIMFLFFFLHGSFVCSASTRRLTTTRCLEIRCPGTTMDQPLRTTRWGAWLRCCWRPAIKTAEKSDRCVRASSSGTSRHLYTSPRRVQPGNPRSLLRPMTVISRCILPSPLPSPAEPEATSGGHPRPLHIESPAAVPPPPPSRIPTAPFPASRYQPFRPFTQTPPG